MATNEEIQEYVQDILLARHESRALKSEPDYFAGAIAALTIAFDYHKRDRLPSCVPPLWTFWPMAGRSVVKKLLGEPDVIPYEEEDDDASW